MASKLFKPSKTGTDLGLGNFTKYVSQQQKPSFVQEFEQSKLMYNFNPSKTIDDKRVKNDSTS